MRANEAAIEIADDEEFFRKVAGAVVKIAPPTGQVSPEAEQAVKQFVSEGLSAGEVLDVFELAALSGGSDDWTADPRLAEIAQALVLNVKRGPFGRLDEPRIHRGGDPAEDQTFAPPLQVRRQGSGWWARAGAETRRRRGARTRAGADPLPLLARDAQLGTAVLRALP